MSINRCGTLEDKVRRLRREMSAIIRRLDEMEERLEKRFDGLESEIKDLKTKTGKSFLALTKPLENQAGNVGVDASNELKEIWRE